MAEPVSSGPWRPDDVLTYLPALEPAAEPRRFACVLLNRPLDERASQFRSVWEAATLRVSVDGGTNVLHQLAEETVRQGQPPVSPPHLICGDFDSITDQARDFFSSQGSEVVPTPDQDHTDFTKSLLLVKERDSRLPAAERLQWVVAVADTSGRLDQTLANISTMVQALGLLRVPVFLLAKDSLSWLLPPGRHDIVFSDTLRDRLRWDSWCSLVPICGPAVCVTTSGLKWNLLNQRLAVGDLISTSNVAIGNLIFVDTSGCLLFSLQIP